VRNAKRRALRRGRACAGFTLVELMVVLVIVGLMGVAVVLTAPGDADTLTREADTLAARLLRAQEEAILTTRAVQVVVDTQGYSFERQDFGQWQPLHEGPFEPVAWAEDTTALLDDRREQVSFRFEPTGGGRETQVLLGRHDRQLRIRVDAAGEVGVDAPR